jgi:hypothetical protein
MTPDADTRAAARLARMVLEDKIHMVHGHVASRYRVPALEHLGIPAPNMTDGPPGVNAGGDGAALREVYLATCEHVVVVTVMSSFNRINGFASAESDLIQQVLKDEWGFQGWIMSDDGSLSAAVPAALAGFDQGMPDVASEAAPATVREGYPDMPGGEALFGGVLRRAIHDGLVPMARPDDMVLCILRTLIGRGVLDRDPAAAVLPDVAAHRALARKVAAEGLTLLHNPKGVRSVLLIGADADRRTGSGGASVDTRSTALVTPHDGIAALCERLGIGSSYLPGADRVGPASMLPGPEAVPSSVLVAPDGQAGLLARYWLSPGDDGPPGLERIDPQVALDIGFLSQLMNASGQEPPPGAFGTHLTVRWTGDRRAPVAGLYRLSITCMGSSCLDVDGRPGRAPAPDLSAARGRCARRPGADVRAPLDRHHRRIGRRAPRLSGPRHGPAVSLRARPVPCAPCLWRLADQRRPGPRRRPAGRGRGDQPVRKAGGRGGADPSARAAVPGRLASAGGVRQAASFRARNGPCADPPDLPRPVLPGRCRRGLCLARGWRAHRCRHLIGREAGMANAWLTVRGDASPHAAHRRTEGRPDD